MKFLSASLSWRNELPRHGGCVIAV